MSHFRRIWWVPPLPSGSSVLEIGAGPGRFAAWAKEARGWAVTCIGSEREPAEYCEFGGPYDAVVAWQVLEHVEEPGVVLRKAYRALRPGGWLVVSVPNTRSVERWALGEDWTGFTGSEEHGRHRWAFSPCSIRSLLRSVGFERARIFYQRLVKGVRWPWPIEIAAGTVLAAFGLSGRMTVVGRRGQS